MQRLLVQTHCRRRLRGAGISCLPRPPLRSRRSPTSRNWSMIRARRCRTSCVIRHDVAAEQFRSESGSLLSPRRSPRPASSSAVRWTRRAAARMVPPASGPVRPSTRWRRRASGLQAGFPGVEERHAGHDPEGAHLLGPASFVKVGADNVSVAAGPVGAGAKSGIVLPTWWSNVQPRQGSDGSINPDGTVIALSNDWNKANSG